MKRLFLVISLLLLASVLPAAAQHGINLAWSHSTSAGVTSQVICRSLISAQEVCIPALATILDNTTNTYLDTTGIAGVQYFYVLEACAGTICSIPSNEANAVFPTVPSPPTTLGAVPQ